MSLFSNMKPESSPIRIVNAIYDDESDDSSSEGSEPPKKRQMADSEPTASRWDTSDPNDFFGADSAPKNMELRREEKGNREDCETQGSIQTVDTPTTTGSLHTTATSQSSCERLHRAEPEDITAAESPSSNITDLSWDLEDSKPCEDQENNDEACCVSSPDLSCPAETPSSTGRPDQKTRKYAMKASHLPPQLKTLLENVKDYFTKPVNLARQGPAIRLTTYHKTEERICGFLGYLKAECEYVSLRQEVFLDNDLIESYVAYLKEERGLSAATIANHLCSILYVLKFLHKDSAPDFKDIPQIQQLRKAATLLQKEGDDERPKTTEELKSLNRWLDWEEILEAVNKQKDKYYMTKNAPKRARELSALLLLSLYCHIPPSRSVEIRELRIIWEDEVPATEIRQQSRNSNIAYMRTDGSIDLMLDTFKNRKALGSDEVKIKSDSELARHMLEYVRKFRPYLTGNGSENYLLLNNCGKPYTSASFSARVKSLFIQLTGVAVSINMLRSSFVTHCYSQVDCTDNLKESIACSLRHSRSQAERTYDRRTKNHKKEAALDLAQTMAENSHEVASLSSSSSQPCEEQVTEQKFKPGDFVGCLGEGSTISKPLIFIGCVQYYVKNAEVALLWYTRDAHGFHLAFDGKPWSEMQDRLVRVTMAPVKRRHGYYSLDTSPRTIHKALSTAE